MALVSMILVLLAQVAGIPEVKNTPVSDALTQCVADIKLAQSGKTPEKVTLSEVTDLEKELKTKKALLEQEIIEIRGVMLTHTYGKDDASYREYIKDVAELSGNSAFYRLDTDGIGTELKKAIVKRINEITAINVKLAKAGFIYESTNLDFFTSDEDSEEAVSVPTATTVKPCTLKAQCP